MEMLIGFEGEMQKDIEEPVQHKKMKCQLKWKRGREERGRGKEGRVN